MCSGRSLATSRSLIVPVPSLSELNAPTEPAQPARSWLPGERRELHELPQNQVSVFAFDLFGIIEFWLSEGYMSAAAECQRSACVPCCCSGA
ncbi:hypothetical protein BQ8482_370004 [Mesorhizobium delmotii]|uniref:Uncharacterized protein n=1 Tax=Mesorhizobium delmotii TaxID=1631247 RepID=A0A2P9ARM5_9HYPH|nr:hypothetical protein BQ8482_370004 [Mesorhizobium delmotii]